MPSPNDPEAILELDINGETVEASRHNCALFTFLGSQAIDGSEVDISAYDHIFVAKRDIDGGAMGSYLFKVMDEEAFTSIKAWIRAQHWGQHIDINSVPGCDIQAFNNVMFEDIDRDNALPAAWLDYE